MQSEFSKRAKFASFVKFKVLFVLFLSVGLNFQMHKKIESDALLFENQIHSCLSLFLYIFKRFKNTSP